MLRCTNSTHLDGVRMGRILHKDLICVNFVPCFTSHTTYNGHLIECPGTPNVITDLHELLGFSKMNPQENILWEIKHFKKKVQEE
jgi:hypothetical protein